MNNDRLKDLNKRYGFIDIVNKKKSESEEYNAELEKLLENNYFIINFDLDIKKVKIELSNNESFLYIKKSIVLGKLRNSVDIEDEECFEGKLILDNCFWKEIDFIFDRSLFGLRGVNLKI